MKHKAARRRPDPRRMTVGKAPKDHVHIGLCLLYSGSGFRGLQFQAHAPTCHTVEGVLIQALRDTGIIAEIVRGRPVGEHHHFSRSCRTDRGVHAIRNMVCFFVPKEVFEEVGQAEGICEKLNGQLPSTVRVANVMLLSGSFIPRHCCNRRVYRYMLPLYALLRPCDTWAALEKSYPGCLADVQMLAKEAVSVQRTHHGVPYVDLAKINVTALSADAQPAASLWLRDLQAKTEQCNKVLRAHFTGSRRYHNFSVDIDSNRSGVSAKVIQPTKDEALRVIYRSEVCPRLFFFPCSTTDGAGDGVPVPLHGESRREYDTNLQRYPPQMSASPEDAKDCSSAASSTTLTSGTNVPFATCLPHNTTVLPFLFFQIEGGSFLLNMIRKVIGSLLAVCRGASESILEEALSPERRVTTPLAPGPYLYLAQSTYHGYDRSIGGTGDAERRGPFRAVQDAWSGAVSEIAEAFAFHNISADVVDVDLNAMPPLDDILAARDRALGETRPQTAVEDAHLAEMKEYKPVLPSRIAWPASSEMTVFLRLLRVHNWNVRPIRLDADCKALREMKNRKERAIASSTAAAASPEFPSSNASEGEGGGIGSEDALEEQTPSPTDDTSKGSTGENDKSEVPEAGEDGWIYLADIPEEVAAQRQAHFARLWRGARRWEYADASGKALTNAEEVSTEDDVEDAAGEGAPPLRRRRR
ncbi:hypothetical protein JKF63_04071 [Porcisia hertigi]|uniref:Pseudouridylate synthase n=1 Tax=Porcisia hertigi TaxID=2761500 RepID=A0A836L9J5_9TRYP|nr:hypothetical protein JKF63_04071 [Porcisia hertigi]